MDLPLFILIPPAVYGRFDSNSSSFTLLRRQINFATLDGLQYLAGLILCLLALSTVAAIGVSAIPMQLLTLPAAVAERLAASAVLARITLEGVATSTARIADLAELGPDSISKYLRLRPSARFSYGITGFRLTGNRQPQFSKSKVLGEGVAVARAKG